MMRLQLKRTCDGCHACCVALSIEEDDTVFKPAHTPCRYLDLGRCSVYEGLPGSELRPQRCGLFYCLWLLADNSVIPGSEELFPIEAQPQNSGVFFFRSDRESMEGAIVGIEYREGALDTAYARSVVAYFLSKKELCGVSPINGPERLLVPTELSLNPTHVQMLRDQDIEIVYRADSLFADAA